MPALAAVFGRELLLAVRHRGDAIQPILFYAIVAMLFPLGASPGTGWMQAIAPAVLWVGALLAVLLGLERVFRTEYEDGTLEQIFLGAQPVSLVVLAKLMGVWMVTGLPLVVLAPLLASALDLDAESTLALVLSLLLGTPSLLLIAGFSAALTIALPRAGALLPILVLPMVSPVLIFGTGAVRAAGIGASYEAPLYFLAAILALCLCTVPLATAAALRNALD